MVMKYNLGFLTPAFLGVFLYIVFIYIKIRYYFYIVLNAFLLKIFSYFLIKEMLKNDLSGLTDEEYEELKQYLKTTYDFDSLYLKPLIIPNDIIIS